jgi:hypothetical protein
MGNGQIAKHCHVSPTFVSDLRKGVGKDTGDTVKYTSPSGKVMEKKKAPGRAPKEPELKEKQDQPTDANDDQNQEAIDMLLAENEELKVRVAVVAMEGTPEEKQAATDLITELRTLRAENARLEESLGNIDRSLELQRKRAHNIELEAQELERERDEARARVAELEIANADLAFIAADVAKGPCGRCGGTGLAPAVRGNRHVPGETMPCPACAARAEWEARNAATELTAARAVVEAARRILPEPSDQEPDANGYLASLGEVIAAYDVVRKGNP